ncbi:MAG: oligopeptidase A [Gemmatimonadota bacterium]|nr:MAG: oligopeptidase A [Gemmatimonadota bacterium]
MSVSLPIRRFFLVLPVAAGVVFASIAGASTTAPLIDYTTVTSAMIEAECEAAMAKSEAILDELIAVPDGKRTFDNTLMPINQLADLMGQTFGKYCFQGYVAQDEAVREVARAQEELLDKYQVDLSFREDLYAAILSYSKTAEAQSLTGERARLLEFTLRDYRRNGFGRGADTRAEVQELRNRLVELSSEFQQELADWKDGIEVPADRTQGLSETFLSGLEKTENGNYWVSLDYPELVPFLDMSEDGELRKAISIKSWNEGYPKNVERLETAIALRDRMAKLLGYESWAHYRMEPRMAQNPERAQAFLADLRAKIQPKLDADIAAMRESYAQNDADGVNYWDWRYYNSLQMRNEYNVDQSKVSEYFPLQNVLEGMFDITQEMFGLRYVEVKGAQVWHPDVQLFEIHDSATGEFIGHFYTDLFPREGKFGHAAAFPLRPGGIHNGKRQTPVSAIVANFTKPTSDRPSLLSHDEVETLFHEYGHILHQTLTRAELRRFAGSSTEQDFVEAPSQNLEHWIWEPEVLNRFAVHYQTGEKFPEEMLAGLIAAKHLNSGIRNLRQVYYASLDLACHGPGEKKDTTQLVRELHPICGFPALEGTHMQAGFGHLFGYDAAYYGYLWSKVYGDDMYTAFEEGGILNPEVGMRYRQEIYEKGGSLDGMDLVRNFLGREPNNRAFLRDLGLEVDAAPIGSH